MGNLSDSVRTLVDEITATTHNRRTRLQELTEETREARRGWQSELQEVSQALRDHFASHRAERATATRARREATHQFIDEIHRVNEQRRVTVSELRSEAHNLVERFSLEHQDMTEALREKLSSASNALKGAVREMVGELAADRRQAHQHWTERLKKKITPEAVVAEAAVQRRLRRSRHSQRCKTHGLCLWRRESWTSSPGTRKASSSSILAMPWVSTGALCSGLRAPLWRRTRWSALTICTTPKAGDRTKLERRHKWQ